jgi:hypothetical protein
MKFFAAQDGVAHHLFALERALPDSQSEMAVEDVQNSTGFDFDIDA